MPEHSNSAVPLPTGRATSARGSTPCGAGLTSMNWVLPRLSISDEMEAPTSMRPSAMMAWLMAVISAMLWLFSISMVTCSAGQPLNGWLFLAKHGPNVSCSVWSSALRDVQLVGQALYGRLQQHLLGWGLSSSRSHSLNRNFNDAVCHLRRLLIGRPGLQ